MRSIASAWPFRSAQVLIALRTAQVAGYSDEQLRAMLGGTANTLADGRALPEPTTPLGADTFAQTLQLARIHQYLSMTTPLLWMRQPDTTGMLGLAINACAERNGYAESVDRIHELLIAARDLWATLPAIEDDAQRHFETRLTFRLIHLADIEAVTAAA